MYVCVKQKHTHTMGRMSYDVACVRMHIQHTNTHTPWHACLNFSNASTRHNVDRVRVYK